MFGGAGKPKAQGVGTTHDVAKGVAPFRFHLGRGKDEELKEQAERRGANLVLVAEALADACWGEGQSLNEASVRAEVVEAVGLDATDLERRIAEPSIKRGLRELTDEAVRLGVFGVPTFIVDGEMFWGHDRLDHLARHLAGNQPPADGLTERLLALPRGVVRKGAPPRIP